MNQEEQVRRLVRISRISISIVPPFYSMITLELYQNEPLICIFDLILPQIELWSPGKALLLESSAGGTFEPPAQSFQWASIAMSSTAGQVIKCRAGAPS